MTPRLQMMYNMDFIGQEKKKILHKNQELISLFQKPTKILQEYICFFQNNLRICTKGRDVILLSCLLLGYEGPPHSDPQLSTTIWQPCAQNAFLFSSLGTQYFSILLGFLTLVNASYPMPLPHWEPQSSSHIPFICLRMTPVASSKYILVFRVLET